ncbi:MAG TPA: carboxypeptidase regulatory-like domain-containing protein [Terriglobales bacterium]
MAAAGAQTLSGNVKNGTNNQPAAGDEVVLMSLAQGMVETGSTKTDSKGEFKLKLDDGKMPHLVKVTHQDVPYYHMVPPGTATADVEVYDAAKKLDAISVTADVMRLQAQQGQLQGIRIFAVNNTSTPPRTQMNEANFQFYLPEGAQVDQAEAMTANGQPISADAVPQKEKNLFAINYPLRPGETQFQVVYHQPYSGSASFDPKLTYKSDHFVVLFPKSMTFTAAPGVNYQGMDDPRQPDANVRLASNASPGQPLGFKISGTGTLGAAGDDSAGPPQPSGQTGGASASTSRPGGGLGPPIDAPDPLEKYRWFILGGFAIVLAGGGIYVYERSHSTPAAPEFVAADIGIMTTSPVAAAPRPAAAKQPMILEALKEEIFQLELEHKQGRISQAEYEKAKAALDQTLERALKRGSAKTG